MPSDIHWCYSHNAARDAGLSNCLQAILHVVYGPCQLLSLRLLHWQNNPDCASYSPFSDWVLHKTRTRMPPTSLPLSSMSLL